MINKRNSRDLRKGKPHSLHKAQAKIHFIADTLSANTQWPITESMPKPLFVAASHWSAFWPRFCLIFMDHRVCLQLTNVKCAQRKEKDRNSTRERETRSNMELSTFKRHVKTSLFQERFPSWQMNPTYCTSPLQMLYCYPHVLCIIPIHCTLFIYLYPLLWVTLDTNANIMKWHNLEKRLSLQVRVLNYTDGPQNICRYKLLVSPRVSFAM